MADQANIYSITEDYDPWAGPQCVSSVAFLRICDCRLIYDRLSQAIRREMKPQKHEGNAKGNHSLNSLSRPCWRIAQHRG